MEMEGFKRKKNVGRLSQLKREIGSETQAGVEMGHGLAQEEGVLLSKVWNDSNLTPDHADN